MTDANGTKEQPVYTKANWAQYGTVAALIVNLLLVVGFATSIQAKLDGTHQASEHNCELIRTALVLVVAQSPRGNSPAGLRVQRTFGDIKCG